MNKIEIKKSLIKEVLGEVEKLNSRLDKREILTTNIEQVKEIIWKIYYNIWRNNPQYNSAITLEELREIHEGYHQIVLANRKSKINW